MTLQGESGASPKFDFGQASVRHAAGMAAVLVVLWLILSGIYIPLTIAMGVLSITLTIYLCGRMKLIDYEGLPLHIAGRTILFYWPWLAVEIAKANWDVVKRILAPTPDIQSTLFTTRATQTSDLGMVIYANSITLTPGTVSVDLNPGQIMVHALSREGAEEVLRGEMDRRCHELEVFDGG